ncbi:uncharacterized protein [Dermacentor albipictus]|uniref:uncharacterized protein n=1 Tax=Dermacentor albipictus TaxID=60249 RepID=UPI0031FD4529
MMLLICTMSFVLRLLCIVSIACGKNQRDSSQEDPESVTYYVSVISADLPGPRPMDSRVDYFNSSVQRRHNNVGNLSGSNDGVVLAAIPSGIPLRRGRRRLLTYGENEMTPSAEERPKLLKRHLGSTALCLLVACLVLLALLLCLAIAALWLRARYRARDKTLYATLSASDPDLPTPATSSTRGRWQLSGEGPLTNAAVGTARWSRKDTKNSTSAPAFRSTKTKRASCLGKRQASPLRSSTDGGQPSAMLTESSEAKATPSPAVTNGSAEGRKLLRVKSTETLLPLRSYSVVRTDTADRQRASDHRSDRDESGKQRSRSGGSRKRRKRRVDPSGHCNAVLGSHNADSDGGASVPTSATSTFKGVDLSEDYHQYSYSDDVRLAPGASTLPLPTIIQRSVTKTIRRWRTRGSAAVSSLWTSSSAEPSVGAGQEAVALPLPARRGRLQQLGSKTIAVTKPEEHRIYTMTDATPWTQLLALCTEPKPVEFQQVIQNNSKAALVRCNDGDGDLFCLGASPAEERLVRVLRLRPQDVRWHTARLRLARELCSLKDNAQNRTSAFFLDARTSLVRDKYPKLLWDARQRNREGPAAGDTSPEDLKQPAHYLVTEIQSGWRPLTSCELPGPAQAESVLEQACWALAVAESALDFEHRLPVVGAVLVRPTRSPRVEFTLRGRLERISSAGFKIRLQGLQMARMTIDARPEYTELSRHREFVVGEEESRVCERMASRLSNQAARFKPLTNVLWLQHLAAWLSRQSAETAAALAPWVRVLAVATSAQDAAEEAADVTANVPAGRRPVHLLRRRRKQPKKNAPRPADKSGGTDHPSATGSSRQKPSSAADDVA